jgi:hypothetical protein
MKKPPIVDIPEVYTLYERSHYNGIAYRTKDMHAMVKGCDTFDMPLAGIDISHNPWNDSLENMADFIWHMKRVEDADLKWAIILSPEGCIIDGYHRVCKAIIEGRTTIRAVRLNEMPRSIKEQDDNV